jgi:hypothetical protein
MLDAMHNGELFFDFFVVHRNEQVAFFSQHLYKSGNIKLPH